MSNMGPDTDFRDGTRSQFPRKWKPIKGSYQANEYSRRGGFGPREAGSALAFSAAIQPAIIFASYQIEQLAEVANPQMGSAGGAAVFGLAWLTQFFISLFFKIAAGFLRNFGEGLLRDLGAWLWSHVLHAMWATFMDTFFGWLPWRRKKRPIWDEPFGPDDQDSEPRRRPIRDWWNNRRKRREQE